MRSQRAADFRKLVARLRREATEDQGVPDRVAAGAAAAVIRRFEDGAETQSDHDTGRVTAYFWGVVRRKAMRERDCGDTFRDRYLVAALADDLIEGGHDPQDVFDEIVRKFGATVSQDVLERFRPSPAAVGSRSASYR
jgi:hypothetical protein